MTTIVDTTKTPKAKKATATKATRTVAVDWTSVRVRVKTVLYLKKLVAAIRKGAPAATLDSVFYDALRGLQTEAKISDATISNTRLPSDGRAAGAQARSARVNAGEAN